MRKLYRGICSCRVEICCPFRLIKTIFSDEIKLGSGLEVSVLLCQPRMAAVRLYRRIRTASGEAQSRITLVVLQSFPACHLIHPKRPQGLERSMGSGCIIHASHSSHRCKLVWKRRRGYKLPLAVCLGRRLHRSFVCVCAHR